MPKSSSCGSYSASREMRNAKFWLGVCGECCCCGALHVQDNRAPFKDRVAGAQPTAIKKGGRSGEMTAREIRALARYVQLLPTVLAS